MKSRFPSEVSRIHELTATTSHRSHRSEVLWSLCVAIFVALVVLEQTTPFRHINEKSGSRSPSTLVTGKPVHLSMMGTGTGASTDDNP